MHKNNRRSNHLGAAIAATLSIALACSAAAADLQTKRTFQIPAQELDKALLAFSDQAKVQVLMWATAKPNQRTAGVKGEFTSLAALKSLLENTGLAFRQIDKETVAIVQSAKIGRDATTALPDDPANAGSFIQLAEAGFPEESTGSDGATKKRKTGGDMVEEMIVQEGRIKPFSDANADIPRTINDPQPYYIFDSQTIERSGALTIEDFLKQRLTMNTNQQSNDQKTANATVLGANRSSINLRGLGSGSTLILVNGRRLSGAVFNTANSMDQPDLNGIPLSAVDRIEVLPSSASGIYGASALGGVVNVILKNNYSGGEFQVSYDNTWDTDAPARRVSFAFGKGLNGGKTHAMVTAQWSDADSLLLQDRRELFDRGFNTIMRNNPEFIYTSTTPFIGVLPNITSTGETIFNPNGTITSIPDPGVLTLKDGRSLGSRSTFISAGTAPSISMSALSDQLFLNAGKWNLELPPTVQSPTGLYRQLSTAPVMKSVMVSLSHQLWPSLKVSLDWRRTQTNTYVPTAVGHPTTITVPSASIRNPFTSAITISNPIVTASSIGTDFATNMLALGFSMKLPHEWRGQADYSWSRTRTQSANPSIGGNYSNDLAAGLINPFADLLMYPLDLEGYRSGTGNIFRSSLHSAVVRASGPLFALPWGTPNLTLGLEHRVSATPEGNGRDLSGLLLIQYFKRQQKTDSLYAEISLPLVKEKWLPLVNNLELQLSGRGERYEVDAGTPSVNIYNDGSMIYASPNRNNQPYFAKASYGSNTGVLGIKYNPLRPVTIRASMSSAFIPPTPEQLLRNPAPNFSPTGVSDPRNNNALVQVQTISGGNPDLSPQNSKGWNAGIIWESVNSTVHNLRLDAEYYRIDQYDVIGSLSAQQIVANEALFPDRVTRNTAGTITAVDTTMLNLYSRSTKGWDLTANYRLRTGVGTFNLNAVESIITNLKQQYSLVQPVIDYVGSPSEGGAAQYKSNATLTWENNRWVAGWSARYFSSYRQYGAAGGPLSQQFSNGGVYSTQYLTPQAASVIPSQTYHDLFVSYVFDKNQHGRSAGMLAELISGVSVQLGVKNVFDKTPPFDVFYDFYISPYGDTRLRSYWLSAKKSF